MKVFHLYIGLPSRKQPDDIYIILALTETDARKAAEVKLFEKRKESGSMDWTVYFLEERSGILGILISDEAIPTVKGFVDIALSQLKERP